MQREPEPGPELARLAAMLAHHLATPLRVVSGHAELVRERLGSPDPDLDQAVEGIERGVEGMQALLDGLLRYASAAEAPGPIESVDAGAEAKEAIAALGDEIADTDAEVSVGELPIVLARSGALRTVFRCLLSNAIQFRGERRPRVEIACRSEPEGWRFRVSDNGVGVQPEDQARIFDPFIRIRVPGARPGVGLGLTLARRIVGHHGGRIWLDSDPGEGSSVQFTLPAPARGALGD